MGREEAGGEEWGGRRQEGKSGERRQEGRK